MNIVLIVGIAKSRAWAYVFTFSLCAVEVLKAFVGLKVAASLSPKDPQMQQGIQEVLKENPTFTEEGAFSLLMGTSITLALLNLLVLLVIAVLSIYCWKKIHPDYSLKNLFTV